MAPRSNGELSGARWQQFPNFTIDAWSGSDWDTVVSETGYPTPDASGAHFAFPVRTTAKLRFRGTDLRIMQLNEIEAFLHRERHHSGPR
jgi:hypothetical protein